MTQRVKGTLKPSVGRMELSDQDSCLPLVMPVMYVIRVCLHIYGVFTGNRATGQSWGVPVQGRVERKHPFSPLPAFLVCNCSGIHQSPGSCSQSCSLSVGAGNWAARRVDRELWGSSVPGNRESGGQGARRYETYCLKE